MRKKVTDEQILSAILISPSATEAAKQLKITKQTLCYRLKKGGLQEKLNRIRQDILDTTLTNLLNNSSKAANTLSELLESENEMTKLTAAKTILAFCERFIDKKDILNRLETLEKQMENN